jgi:hypothetical protein
MSILIEKIIEDLWLNEKSIAYFICNNTSYWVLDYKYHYQLDEEIEAKALLDTGHITLDVFNNGLKNSRGGISKLNKDNFDQYLSLEETIILKQSDLNEIIRHNFSSKNLSYIYSNIERHLSFDNAIEDNIFYEINKIKSRLPKYYINFDRQIYLHTDYDFSPESSVSYDNWLATDGDFSYYILDKDVYWILEDQNFWKAIYL